MQDEATVREIMRLSACIKVLEGEKMLALSLLAEMSPMSMSMIVRARIAAIERVLAGKGEGDDGG